MTDDKIKELVDESWELFYDLEFSRSKGMILTDFEKLLRKALAMQDKESYKRGWNDAVDKCPRKKPIFDSAVEYLDDVYKREQLVGDE